ncbi:DICT sensory domain-containing protein [Sphaerothrix gracilis]|uniref:DICT sensory domain-containing protein n=1 Tax=Sphaerothrix gracilis TaxID=3151835 RepID=UPI0031FD69C0
MSNPDSVLEELLQEIPQIRSQLYFKASLTALSHAMEDQVLAGSEQSLVIASFQQERFYRQEAHRYERIAEMTPYVYVLSAAGTGFADRFNQYETITFDAEDALTQEWHLIVVGAHYSACLVCRERQSVDAVERSAGPPALDQTRRFEGIWTLDAQISQKAADILLTRIVGYRPDLAEKVAQAKAAYIPANLTIDIDNLGTDPFAQRLITYLQAGQYKLLKAYKAISSQERRERLVNSITGTIRRSLNPAEIFQVAVHELGQALEPSRCLIYRGTADDVSMEIQHEHLSAKIPSLVGEIWPLEENPLFCQIRQQPETILIPDITEKASPYRSALETLKPLFKRWKIQALLMVPLVHQGRLVGMIELHCCQSDLDSWSDNDVALVEAIAAQLSIAIMQAEAYAHLEQLNQQLEDLEQTRSNLIAITGHELRTPLSTIQVCLESLATEPDMPMELKQVMLDSALHDAERLRKLVQDFLTLSRLESGRIVWNLESLSLQECVDLALSSLKAKYGDAPIPKLKLQLPAKLPLVKADGEWLVEVLNKLLDNACKFTPPEGKITLKATAAQANRVQITVADTGRGIEPNRLEAVFDRFYQEEGALRRTTGGTGLGLAICRQIVTGMGGQIWATSAGKDRGSQFHFTLPVAASRANGQPQPQPATVVATAGKKQAKSLPAIAD